jgi:hypothetical protein
MPLEVPLEAERVESRAISRVRGLKSEKDGHGVDRVLESAAQNTGQM